MNDAKNRSIKINIPLLLRWAGTLLALALMIYLLRQQGWGEIVAAIRKVPFWRFVVALGLTFVSRFAVTGRWHVLLSSAGVKIPARQTLRITFAGLFASNFLPTTIGGDVVRLGGAIRLGYDRAVSLASLVVDRLIGMAGMAMAALTLLFSLPEILQALKFGHAGKTPNTENLNALNDEYLFAGGAVASAGWWSALKEKTRHVFKRLLETLRLWVTKPQALLEALAFTWVHMLCVFASIWFLLPGLGEFVPYWQIAGLWALTYFVTLLPISVNGLGVQELSMTFFFTTFGGIAAASGLTMALFMRLLPMFASLPGAIFIPGMLAGDKK
jgi:uncharacterized membrane protein YbhN (UPF0104 family)